MSYYTIYSNNVWASTGFRPTDILTKVFFLPPTPLTAVDKKSRETIFNDLHQGEFKDQIMKT